MSMLWIKILLLWFFFFSVEGINFPSTPLFKPISTKCKQGQLKVYEEGKNKR